MKCLLRTAATAAACLATALWLQPVNAQPPLEYLEQPEVLWVRGISDNPGKGNQLYLSPDSRALYLTTVSGNVLARRPQDGNSIGSFTLPANDRGWDVHCHSGIAFYFNDTAPDLSYFVFTVVDTPPLGSPAELRQESRVIALNHRIVDGDATIDTPRWISPPLQGVAAGTPVISSDGQYVYLTRTSTPLTTPPPTVTPSEQPTAVPTVAPSASPSSTPSATPSVSPSRTPTEQPVAQGPGNRNLQAVAAPGTIAGFFTMLSDQNSGAVIFDAQGDSLLNNHYGPLAIARNPIRGSYIGGDGNTNDVLVWHSLPDPDQSPDSTPDGETQLFQLPVDFDGVDTSNLEVEKLGTTLWVTNTAPAISSDGQKLFIGSSGSVLYAWDDKLFSLTPSYSVSLANDGTDTPPPQPPVLSVDEQLVFAATTTTAFQAVNVTTGSVAWTSENLPDVVGTKAVPSPDGRRVYFASGSRLYGRDVTDGSDAWNTFGFTSEQVDPDSIIETDFTLSTDGRLLYYTGFRSNRIMAIRLASPPVDTDSPSASPSTSPPTVSASPTLSPAPSVSSRPSMAPSSSPSSAPTTITSAPTVDSEAPTIFVTRSPTTPPTRRPTRLPTVEDEVTGDDDDGPSIGLIVGVAIAAVVVLAIVAYLVSSVFRGRGGGRSGNTSGANAAYVQDDDGGGYNASAYTSGGEEGGRSSGRRPYPPPSNDGVSGKGGTSTQRRPYPPGGGNGASQPAGGQAGSSGPRRPYPPQQYQQSQPQQGYGTPANVPHWATHQ